MPMTFRYAVAADHKVNAFKAKEIPPTDSKLDLRSAVFGALWSNKFNQLPRTDYCSVVWEAQGLNKC